MKRSQNGFAHFLVLLLLIIATGVVGFTAWRVIEKNNSHETATNSSILSTSQKIITDSSVPSCNGTNVFTVSPAVDGTYDSITPLGNTSSNNGTAGHVIPVDHLYFNLRRSQPGNFQSPTLAATIVSPGDLTIYSITSQDYTVNGQATGHDYQLSYQPCRGVVGYLGHVDTLSPNIQSALDHPTKKTCGNSFTTGPGGPSITQCEYTLQLKLKTGDAIGTAGGPNNQVKAASFDFGTYDSRIQPLPFIAKRWTPNNLHAVCGISYYPDGPVKTSLFKHLMNTKINTDGLPDCGTNMWDEAGTIQGNWVLPNTPVGNIPDNQNGLAILHLNTDPTQGNIDWGGTIAPANKLTFPILIHGLVNRDPAQVTADGKIYCFENTAYGPAYSMNTYIQLIDSNSLRIEYHKTACPPNPNFSNPTTYVR